MPARFLSPAFSGFFLAVFALTTVVARGETQTHAEMRRVIFESFRFDPESPAKNQEKPVPDPDLAQPVESDPELIVLPKFEIRSRPLPRGLAEAIATSRPLEPQNHSRFGTGIHEKDFGKVRAYAVTVLYVPICLGLSW